MYVSCGKLLGEFCFFESFFIPVLFELDVDCEVFDDDDGAAVDAVDDGDDVKNGTNLLTLCPRFFQFCLLFYLLSLEHHSEQAILFLFVVLRYL